MARIAAVGVGVAAIVGTLLVGTGVQRHGARRAWPSSFAASANFPPLLLALNWRRFNTAGALIGVAFGMHRLGGHDRPEPADVARAGLAGLAVVADLPRPRHDPDRLPGLLAGDDARPARQRGRGFVRRAARALGDRPGSRGRPRSSAGAALPPSRNARANRWPKAAAPTRRPGRAPPQSRGGARPGTAAWSRGPRCGGAAGAAGSAGC